VYAPSPAQTSAVVWWLRDLMRPVGLSPYHLTFVHTAPSCSCATQLLMCNEAMLHFKNTTNNPATQVPLATDFRPYFTIHDKEAPSLTGRGPPMAGLVLGVTNPQFARTCAHWPHVLSLGAPLVPTGASAPAPGASKGKGPTMGMGMPGPPPGWMTKTHKRHVSKDRPLLKRIEDAYASGNKRSRTSFSWPWIHSVSQS
jgi:hypothetical protein